MTDSEKTERQFNEAYNIMKAMGWVLQIVEKHELMYQQSSCDKVNKLLSDVYDIFIQDDVFDDTPFTFNDLTDEESEESEHCWATDKLFKPIRRLHERT